MGWSPSLSAIVCLLSSTHSRLPFLTPQKFIPRFMGPAHSNHDVVQEAAGGSGGSHSLLPLPRAAFHWLQKQKAEILPLFLSLLQPPTWLTWSLSCTGPMTPRPNFPRVRNGCCREGKIKKIRDSHTDFAGSMHRIQACDSELAIVGDDATKILLQVFTQTMVSPKN